MFKRATPREGGACAAGARRWPHVVVDGEIDRARLASVVFSDSAELAALESITHPAIAARIATAVAAAGDQPVIVELPLVHDFLGTGWVWVLVDTPADTRLERAVARGADPADVSARMSSQQSDTRWHDMADWIVPNTGTVEELETAAAELWSALTAAA